MNLKKLLEERGLKIIWFAKKVGVSRQSVSSWVNNKYKPTPENLIKINKVLGFNSESKISI